MAEITVTTKLKSIPIESVIITVPFETAVKLRTILGGISNCPDDLYSVYIQLRDRNIGPANVEWLKRNSAISGTDL